MAQNHWRELTGQTLGNSEWLHIDQARIDAFAEVTMDRQFIHVDPVAAAKARFGGTVAHGLIIQSLLPYLTYQIFTPFQSQELTFVNYGSDRVRFLQPVRSGNDIRCQVVLAGCEERDDNFHLLRLAITVEIRNETRPAMVADALTLIIEN